MMKNSFFKKREKKMRTKKSFSCASQPTNPNALC